MPTQRQQQAKSTISNPASIFLGFWRWIRQYDITKHASTTSHFRNFLRMSTVSQNEIFCPNVEIADRMLTQRQQQAKSTTNNPASILFGIRRWIRRFDLTKHASTTSHFRNFLMSKSKWDFLSERRNRRSNAVSIIWARVQQSRFTGEIIVPKPLLRKSTYMFI